MTGKGGTRKPSAFSQVAGLGLGRDALQEVQGSAKHRTLPLAQLHVQEGHNPRGRFDQEAFTPARLADLAQSIREEGVLTPLWVRHRPQGGHYIIAGERRYHAAQLAGLRDVPVLEYEADEARAALLALIENGQREELHFLDETYAGFRLLTAHTGLEGEALVAYLGRVRKGRSSDEHGVDALLRATFGTGLSVWAQYRALVFAMTPQELAAVWEGHLDFSVAAALTRLPEGEVRARLLAQALEEGLNAAQVKALVDTERGAARDGGRTLSTSVRALRTNLGRIERLEGAAAQRAEALIRELQALLPPPGQRN